MLLTLGCSIGRLIFYSKNPSAESPSEHEGSPQQKSAHQAVPTTAPAQGNSSCLYTGAKACLVLYCNHAFQKKLAGWKQLTISYHKRISQWNSYISVFNPGNEWFTSCFKALVFANTGYCYNLRTSEVNCCNTQNMGTFMTFSSSDNRNI